MIEMYVQKYLQPKRTHAIINRQKFRSVVSVMIKKTFFRIDFYTEPIGGSHLRFNNF